MYKNKFTPIILPIIIIVIWYLITSVLHLVTSYTLPSPIDVCIESENKNVVDDFYGFVKKWEVEG